MRKLTLIALAAFALALAPTAARAQANDAAVARNLALFNKLYKELVTYYVDTIDADHSIQTAIDAMLYEMDPYTEYISAKEAKDFLVVSTGEYGGIGSYINQRTGDKKGVYISGPYAGSPAAKAGLRSGDRIIMIDGDSATNWTSEQVSQRLKGQPGTTVRLRVARPYVADSILDFNIRRETIKVDPVTYYGVTHDNIGYICLSTFNEQSARQVKDALIALKKDPRVKAIALDLRGNGGGVVEAAIQIVGCFVPKGTRVLVMRGREKNSEKTYKTTSQPIDTKIPLAVLINGGSASASEITAGALQDLDRAVIIGQRSYGKGLVQTTRPLPLDAMLKVTIAKYYLPSGRLIQEVDYSQRNADGSFKNAEDAATDTTTKKGEPYYTAAGRTVYGGAGITPDIEVKTPEATRLVYNVVRDSWDFDYATRYAATHPSIPDPDHFEITDEIWQDFKQSIDPKKFEYDKVCEQQLQKLRKAAENEGYMNDSVKSALDHLESLLRHDLDHDLDLHRKEISTYLAQEILDRYYYRAGQVQYGVRYDDALARAKELFDSPTEYTRTLHR